MAHLALKATEAVDTKAPFWRLALEAQESMRASLQLVEGSVRSQRLWVWRGILELEMWQKAWKVRVEEGSEFVGQKVLLA